MTFYSAIALSKEDILKNIQKADYTSVFKPLCDVHEAHILQKKILVEKGK